MSNKGKIGIVGSGLIGRTWAMLFAGAGYSVVIYDVESSKVEEALPEINERLLDYERLNLLKGNLSAAETFNLIKKCNTLEECVSNSIHVQECVFEDLELKTLVFKTMDVCASNEVVLSSSTSCFPPSSFSEDLVHKSQVIVAHPINPPYFIPLVEIIPSPSTDPSIIERTRDLMIEVGQKPVILKKEVLGFAVNRIQYALLNECYRIYEDGIMSLEDIEKAMSQGLGPNYAFVGPFEDCHLNADGMLDYCKENGKNILKVSETFGANRYMEGETIEKIDAELNKRRSTIDERRDIRENHLKCIYGLKIAFKRMEENYMNQRKTDFLNLVKNSF